MKISVPELSLVVGPEGGLTETELDALSKLPFVTRVGLGPRVLRAETAALAALAVVWHHAGYDFIGAQRTSLLGEIFTFSSFFFLSFGVSKNLKVSKLVLKSNSNVAVVLYYNVVAEWL